MLTNNLDYLSAMSVASQSMAASFNMPAVYVFNNVMASAQLVFTGTANGAFKLQGSNDHKVTTNFLPVNWTDIPSSSTTVSTAGSVILRDPEVSYAWLRVVYTAAGAGTAPVLTVARLVVKGV